MPEETLQLDLPFETKPKRKKTPSFVTTLPLCLTTAQEHQLEYYFEAARQLYNACLGEAMRRLSLLRQSKDYQVARKLPKGKARTEAFAAAQNKYDCTEAGLHRYATGIRNSWIKRHMDSNTAQTLASRAFDAMQKVQFGKARKVRFKTKGRLHSIEGKTNSMGLRFHKGHVHWNGREMKALKLRVSLNPNNLCEQHGLKHPIKYVRLVRRTLNGKARYYVQLINEGLPYRAGRQPIGDEVTGLDLGPSTIAITNPKMAALHPFCSALERKEQEIRQLQRQLDRQRRANNPDNFNPDGTIKKLKLGEKRVWHDSHGYLQTKRKLAELHRKQATHRASQHGAMVNQILSFSHTVKLERASYRAWQKNFGRSVSFRAPGAFVTRLKRTAASAGATVVEFSTRTTKLSQTCLCGHVQKKKLSERTHRCPKCGLVMQRDLMSAYLAGHVEADTLQAASAKRGWASAEPLLMTAWRANQLASAGQIVQPLREKRRQSQSSSNWHKRIVSSNSVAATKASDVVPGGPSCMGELTKGRTRYPESA